MKTTITAGNKGKGIRSDCFISIEPAENSGITLNVESKVKALFGENITEIANNAIEIFEIKDAIITIEDFGALPFVLMARLEATFKKFNQSKKLFLPKMLDENLYSTARDRNRFSRLYLPGNSPALMINAGLHKPDGIILDLEDAVAPDKKYEASFLVRNALLAVNFYGTERMVRINQIPRGLEDLEFIVPYNVNLILVPKCESAKQIHQLNNKIAELQSKYNVSNEIWLMPIIESALGVLKAFEIASAAKNVVSLAIGLEDYTADLGTKRTNEGTESFFARSQVVNACRAAGIQPIDSVFSDISDMEALKLNVQKSKSLGFDGMGCIHPRQIRVIYENFAPEKDEIEKAKKIVNAFIEATEKGLGVVSLGTKMIDAPVVKRAQKTIDLAIATEKITKNWREENYD